MKSSDASVPQQTDLQCDELGRALALRLSEGATATPHHINERLKAARYRAVVQRRTVVRATRFARASYLLTTGGSTAFRAGDEDSGWSRRWAAVLPVVALLAGLFAINTFQMDSRDAELAEVDAALLTDDLPPAAYADPGFIQFLKWSHEHNE